MNKLYLAGITTIFLSGCAYLGFEQEQDIEINQVPTVVTAAATKAVPGFIVESAELEKEDGKMVYELEGTANGKEYEIEISETGEVLEVESDDDEDDGSSRQ